RAVVEAGYADVVRADHPGPGVYTYWDYQQLRFPKREGMRIDFVLGSPAVESAVTGSFIDREERRGKGASDHATVVVDLEFCSPGRATPPGRAWCRVSSNGRVRSWGGVWARRRSPHRSRTRPSVPMGPPRTWRSGRAD